MAERVTLASLHRDVTELRAETAALRTETKAQTAATKELVEAWKTATGVVRFVKWTSTLVTAIGVIWAAIRYGVWPSS